MPAVSAHRRHIAGRQPLRGRWRIGAELSAAHRKTDPAVRRRERHRSRRPPDRRPAGEALGQGGGDRNRPGGDGIVSIAAFTGANDDHTLWWGPVGVFAVHPYDKEKLPYNAERDLIPIANVSSLSLSLSAPAAMKLNTFREYFEHVRANPGKYNAPRRTVLPIS